MPDLNFSNDGRAYFPTKYNGEVSLSKEKWDRICSQPERYYYRHNGEKVATALINPGHCRFHRDNPALIFYYKDFPTYKLTDKAEGPIPWIKFMVVLIDKSTQRICTVYPTPRVKAGKEYRGETS